MGVPIWGLSVDGGTIALQALRESSSLSDSTKIQYGKGSQTTQELEALIGQVLPSHLSYIAFFNTFSICSFCLRSS